MRLATLRDGTRDGALIVVGRDGRSLRAGRGDRAHAAGGARRLGSRAAPALAALAARLDGGGRGGEPLDDARLGPPLPRAYEWIDGSAFLEPRPAGARGARRRAAADAGDRSAGLPGRLGRAARAARRHPARRSGLGPRLRERGRGDPGRHAARNARRGRARRTCASCCWPTTSRCANLVPDELAKGFGFFQSKPATAFSPFAVTPDELGGAWRDGRVHLPLRTTLNERRARTVGDPDAGRDALFVLRSRSPTSRARAPRAPGRSWAAAPSRTPTARAASPAWSSGARWRQSTAARRRRRTWPRATRWRSRCATPAGATSSAASSSGW